MNTKALKDIIRSKFDSQQNFSKSLGWTNNKISRIIRGAYLPDVDEICLISNKLELTRKQYEIIFTDKFYPAAE